MPAVSISAAPPFDTMPDGSWLGSLVYNAQVSFPGDTQAEAKASGKFDFVVAGGLVTEGTFEFSASGFGTANSAAAIAALDLVGTGGVEGTASEPVLRSDSVHLSGTASSQGLEVPIDMAFGADELTPIPLQIFTVDCEMVTGSFEQAIAASIAASGGAGTYVGRWVALRGDDPASAGTMGAYEQLIADAEVIVNAAKAGGPIDPVALLDALDRAEQFAASTPINAACRNLQPDLAEGFSLSISGLISDLIEAVLTAPSSVNLTVLQDVVAAGVRTGVLSANAEPGSLAENFSIQLQAEFESRLDVALGPPALTDDVQQIMLTALTMGWTSTAEKAAAAL
jgi:hypothetical protein